MQIGDPEGSPYPPKEPPQPCAVTVPPALPIEPIESPAEPVPEEDNAE